MKRVLIIDDHEPSRKTLVKTLTQSGYEIAGQGASRETAVALTTTTSPDIILMAVGLPDIDGIKAACNIMQAKPLPIILITSHHDSTTVQRATKSGAGLFDQAVEKRNLLQPSSWQYRASEIFVQPRVCSSPPTAFLPAALCLISPNRAVWRLHRFADSTSLLWPASVVPGARQNIDNTY